MLADRCIVPDTFLAKYAPLCGGDKYDEKTNPDGCIDLGIAANGIHSDIVHKKLQDEVLDFGPNAYQYFAEHGTKRLQNAMAEFLTVFFESSQPVQPDDLYFTTSVASAVDILAHCIAEPGDVFLAVTPNYQGITYALKHRSLVDIWPVPLTSQSEKPFHLTIKNVESSYEQAVQAGKCVKGMILLNPGNPIGYVVNSSLLKEMLQFCHKYQLHFISDEAYAMSVHDPEVNFYSILKFPSLPDPNRTHLVYAISKDLGLTKLRVGVLHTYNKTLQKHLKMTANYRCAAYPVMQLLASILEDKEWCATLFRTMRSRLRDRYLAFSQKLRTLNLEVHQTSACIYFWANFKKYCQPLTFKSEEQLFSRLVQEAKVIIYPGALFDAPEPGWFRILFTQDENTMEKAVQRLEKFLAKLDAE